MQILDQQIQNKMHWKYWYVDKSLFTPYNILNILYTAAAGKATLELPRENCNNKDVKYIIHIKVRLLLYCI